MKLFTGPTRLIKESDKETLIDDEDFTQTHKGMVNKGKTRDTV